ncbi:MAG: RNA methyltransferase [Cytophagaceae bacterium]|jgi:TrmH family RNA methyltransferase|nr:RNA methyltransferase [Cytophagaceae bacterium]
MLSKNQLKFIKSLQIKKFRHEYQQFLVEGAKSVQELWSSRWQIELLLGTASFLRSLPALPHRIGTACQEVNEEVLTQASTLANNTTALAVVAMPAQTTVQTSKSWILALDDVRDPGNLGTIIRMADWYGISEIICSHETAEVYNPKVIASSMGSFLRIRLEYASLASKLPSLAMPVYAADMHGEHVHRTTFPSSGILLLGNEANGVHPNLQPYITQRITIPRIGSAESLNVAMAGAIILDNIVRCNSPQ